MITGLFKKYNVFNADIGKFFNGGVRMRNKDFSNVLIRLLTKGSIISFAGATMILYSDMVSPMIVAALKIFGMIILYAISYMLLKARQLAKSREKELDNVWGVIDAIDFEE